MKFVMFKVPGSIESPRSILVDVERVSMVRMVQGEADQYGQGFRSVLTLEDGSGSNTSLDPYCEVSVSELIHEVLEKLESECPNT